MGEAVEIPVRVYRSSQRASGDDEAAPDATNLETTATSECPIDEVVQLRSALRELKKDFQRVRDHAANEQRLAREAGEELAVKGLQEMEQAEEIAYAARDIAAEGAAEVAVGSAALGSAAAAADFAGELEEKAR